MLQEYLRGGEQTSGFMYPRLHQFLFVWLPKLLPQLCVVCPFVFIRHTTYILMVRTLH